MRGLHPRWLETWNPGDSLPATATRGDLLRVNRALDMSLRPAEIRHIGWAVTQLIEGLEALGIKIGPERDEQRRSEARFRLGQLYTDAVKGLPADLVTEACRRALQLPLYGRPPTPHDVAATVAEERHMRTRLRARALLAARSAPDAPVKPMTPAERAAAHQVVAEALAKLDERAVPRTVDDLAPVEGG